MVQPLGKPSSNIARTRTARAAMTIPDHIDMLCEMEQGGQMFLA